MVTYSLYAWTKGDEIVSYRVVDEILDYSSKKEFEITREQVKIIDRGFERLHTRVTKPEETFTILAEDVSRYKIQKLLRQYKDEGRLETESVNILGEGRMMSYNV